MADSENMQDYSDGSGEFGEESHRVDFYDSEVNRYAATLDEDLPRAFDRYGFSLFHSLPAAKQVEVAQKTGLMKGDAIDQYNLAGLAIEREDYAKAIDLLKKAIHQDSELADAEYNLALCYEKQGNRNDAVKHWNRYIELEENEETLQQAQAHLAELTA
jgi:tetratricopeptide (TPR) repeat protein